MKRRFCFYLFTIILVSFIFIQGCKKDENNDNSNNYIHTTVPTVPVLTTTNVNTITLTSVKCAGRIISDGGAVITVSGVCWDTAHSPIITDCKTTDGAASGSYTSSVTGLIPNTTYYIRAYATNSAGTGYANERIVKTGNSTVIDADGNLYYTIIIGTQEWMIENLKTTKYRNGDQIQYTPDEDAQWDTLTIGAYCNKNNDTNVSNTYGKLYNWYAVSDARNIAPTGCHIPSDAEWNILENYLGGSDIAGGKMKEAGLTHWAYPNTGADNSSGFMALPSGSRPYSGVSDIGISAYWWSSDDSSATHAWARQLDIYGAYIVRNYAYKWKVGFSVRCLKD